MPSTQGYGSMNPSGKGRGVFSEKKNMMPKPKFASDHRENSQLQGRDSMKVMEMAKKQRSAESLRGEMS